MLLRNKAEKLQLDVRHARHFFTKAFGLMFRHNFNHALVFHMSQGRARNSVHMLFVFCPITILFLDENQMVVDKAVLKPFTINYTPKANCQYIVELPKKYENIFNIGDQVEWN